MSERLAYTVADAAKALGVGEKAVYELIHQGQLRSIKVGRRMILPRHELERFLFNGVGDRPIAYIPQTERMRH
ncbi:MAG TPA: helix-turn-helix domain-containing protein [Dehalococcoidia bacterium]|nr:helix-turn-helix domain-containing protein [Dehalococcoidia bacterium]